MSAVARLGLGKIFAGYDFTPKFVSKSMLLFWQQKHVECGTKFLDTIIVP
jgi:hypothetical protein